MNNYQAIMFMYITLSIFDTQVSVSDACAYTLAEHFSVLLDKTRPDTDH